MHFEFFAFPFCGWGVFFFQQHFTLLNLESQGQVVTGRNDTVYWFSMLLALWMNYEVGKSCIELLIGNKESMDNAPYNDQRVNVGRHQLPDTGRSTNTVTNFETIGDQKPATGKYLAHELCSVDSLYLQYGLMFQHHYRSVHSTLSKFYNTIWVMRWVVFAVFAIIWFKFPRTLYILYLIINVGMIIITVLIKSSFRFGFGLILVEEILVCLWHLAALINYLDYYGSRGMSSFFVNLNTHIMFWAFIITVIIELVLLILGAMNNRKHFNAFPNEHREKAMSESQGLKIDIESNNELQAKIKTYTSMKQS